MELYIFIYYYLPFDFITNGDEYCGWGLNDEGDMKVGCMSLVQTFELQRNTSFVFMYVRIQLGLFL